MAKVTDEAFNLVQSKISTVIGAPSNSVFDLGYNLSVTSVPAVQGARVVGQDLNRVIQDLNTVVEHQTGSPTNLSTFPKGKTIETADLQAVSTRVDTAFTNRNNVGIGRLAVVNSDSYSNGTPWASSHRYKIRFDWGSNAQFRGWANLGGFIAIGGNMSGGSGSNQTASWNNLLTSVGLIVISANGAVQNGQTRNGSFPNGGLYNIIQNGQSGINASVAFRILASDANYTSNSFTIYITPVGGTGAAGCTGFNLEYVLLDQHVATGQGPDLVDGTLGLSVNTYFAFEKSPAMTNSGPGLGTTLG